MALMVSYTFSIPEPIRRQVLFLTAGIVTLTLTINATTIGWLLKKLGLAEIPSSKLLLDYSVKEQLYEGSVKYLKDLKQKEALEATDWSIVEQFLPQKEIYPEMPVRTKDVMADIRLRILDRERSLYWSLYTNGVISSGTQRRLNAAIDEQYDRDGKKPLCDRGDIFEFCEEPSWIISMKFFSRFFQKWADIRYTFFLSPVRGYILVIIFLRFLVMFLFQIKNRLCSQQNYKDVFRC